MFKYKNTEIYPVQIKHSIKDKKGYITYVCNDGNLYILFRYNTKYDFISSNIAINKKYSITYMKVGYLYILTDLVKLL